MFEFDEIIDAVTRTRESLTMADVGKKMNTTVKHYLQFTLKTGILQLVKFSCQKQ